MSRRIPFFLALICAAAFTPQSHAAEMEAAYPFYLHSALRLPHESAGTAYRRYVERLRAAHGRMSIEEDSAANAARPPSQVDFSHVPAWHAQFSLPQAFSRLRDTRFIDDPERRGFKRRSSWLYPDDGCFARAALMRMNLQQWGAAAPAKLFIFGDLQVRTSNSPAGSVSWWYHVVPLFRVGQQLFVLDPAINPKNPMLIQDWVLTMTDHPEKVKLAVCDAKTYSPSDACSSPAADSSTALIDQVGYLQYEWSRLVQLHRDPVQELGDRPPWLTALGAASTISEDAHASLRAQWKIEVRDENAAAGSEPRLSGLFLAEKTEAGDVVEQSGGIWPIPGDPLKGPLNGRIMASAAGIEATRAVLRLSLFDTSNLPDSSPHYRSRFNLELPLEPGQSSVIAFTLGDATNIHTVMRELLIVTLDSIEHE